MATKPGQPEFRINIVPDVDVAEFQAETRAALTGVVQDYARAGAAAKAAFGAGFGPAGTVGVGRGAVGLPGAGAPLAIGSPDMGRGLPMAHQPALMVPRAMKRGGARMPFIVSPTQQVVNDPMGGIRTVHGHETMAPLTAGAIPIRQKEAARRLNQERIAEYAARQQHAKQLHAEAIAYNHALLRMQQAMKTPAIEATSRLATQREAEYRRRMQMPGMTGTVAGIAAYHRGRADQERFLGNPAAAEAYDRMAARQPWTYQTTNQIQNARVHAQRAGRPYALMPPKVPGTGWNFWKTGTQNLPPGTDWDFYDGPGTDIVPYRRPGGLDVYRPPARTALGAGDIVEANLVGERSRGRRRFGFGRNRDDRGGGPSGMFQKHSPFWQFGSGVGMPGGVLQRAGFAGLFGGFWGVAGVGAGAAAAGAVQAYKYSAEADSSERRAVQLYTHQFKELEQRTGKWRDTLGSAKHELFEVYEGLLQILKPITASSDEAERFSFAFGDIAAQLAYFKNADMAEVGRAIQRATVGEFENLKTYGIPITKDLIRGPGNKELVAGSPEYLAALLPILQKYATPATMYQAPSSQLAVRGFEGAFKEMAVAIGREVGSLVEPIMNAATTVMDGIAATLTNQYKISHAGYKATDVLSNLTDIETIQTRDNLIPGALDLGAYKEGTGTYQNFTVKNSLTANPYDTTTYQIFKPYYAGPAYLDKAAAPANLEMVKAVHSELQQVMDLENLVSSGVIDYDATLDSVLKYAPMGGAIRKVIGLGPKISSALFGGDDQLSIAEAIRIAKTNLGYSGGTSSTVLERDLEELGEIMEALEHAVRKNTEAQDRYYTQIPGKCNWHFCAWLFTQCRKKTTRTRRA